MKTISFLLCSLFVFVPIYAATNPIQKNMALFFDFKLEEQEGRGPLTAECADALKNKENIDAIILNKGLWNNIVQVYMLDKTTVSAYWEIYEQDSFIIVVPKEITTPLNLSGATKLDESNAFPSESFFFFSKKRFFILSL